MKTGGHPSVRGYARRRAQRYASGFTISAAPQRCRTGSAQRSRARFARSPGSCQAGFTIVETLIVLAITSALFVLVAITISGKQNKTEFHNAINDAQQEIQQVVNEAASGYFPSNQSFSCTGNGAANTPPSIVDDGTGTGNGQGSNGGSNGCVFLGKVMQFGLNASQHDGYIVWPIVGNQNPLSIDTQTLNGAYPAPVRTINTSGTLQFGLNAASMYYNNDPSQTISGVGFLAGNDQGVIAGADSTNHTLASLSQQISLYAIKSAGVTQPTNTEDNMYAGLKSTSGGPSNPQAPQNIYLHADSVEICFNSATTDQHGLVTIGNGSGTGGTKQQLTVTLQIKDSTC